MAHLVKDAKLPDEPFFVGTFRLHLTTTAYCLLICPILSDEYLLIPHSEFIIPNSLLRSSQGYETHWRNDCVIPHSEFRIPH